MTPHLQCAEIVLPMSLADAYFNFGQLTTALSEGLMWTIGKPDEQHIIAQIKGGLVVYLRCP